MSVSDSLRVQVAAAIHETLCGLLCDDEKPEDHDYDAADRVLSLLALTEEKAVGYDFDADGDFTMWGSVDRPLNDDEVALAVGSWGNDARRVTRFVGPWVPDDVQSGP